MMAASRYSAAQVCQIVTGEDGEVDFVFAGSDDELDALELDQEEEPDEEGGLSDREVLAAFTDLEREEYMEVDLVGKAFSHLRLCTLLVVCNCYLNIIYSQPSNVILLFN